MRGQDSQYNCGPTALHNALSAIGRRRSIKECEVLCGATQTEGTDPDELLAAARAVLNRGSPPFSIHLLDPASAIAILRDALRRGRPVILAVDEAETEDEGGARGHDASHYVAAVGLLGDRVLVADSADAELVLSVPDYKLLARWGVRLKDPEPGGPTYTYWGVIL